MRRGNALAAEFAPRAAENVPPRDRESGKDVGDQRVLELLYLVLETELALLHPGKLERIAIARAAHHVDLCVEAAVLGFQDSEKFDGIVVVH